MSKIKKSVPVTIEPELVIEGEAKVYYVAKGCSITTRRGILSEGAEIRQDDLPEASFNQWVSAGKIE